MDGSKFIPKYKVFYIPSSSLSSVLLIKPLFPSTYTISRRLLSGPRVYCRRSPDPVALHRIWRARLEGEGSNRRRVWCPPETPPLNLGPAKASAPESGAPEATAVRFMTRRSRHQWIRDPRSCCHSICGPPEPLPPDLWPAGADAGSGYRRNWASRSRCTSVTVHALQPGRAWAPPRVCPAKGCCHHGFAEARRGRSAPPWIYYRTEGEGAG